MVYLLRLSERRFALHINTNSFLSSFFKTKKVMKQLPDHRIIVSENPHMRGGRVLFPSLASEPKKSARHLLRGMSLKLQTALAATN